MDNTLRENESNCQQEKHQAKSNRLDMSIQNQYGVTFRQLNPAIVNSALSKIEAAYTGDLRGIARNVFAAAFTNDPWVSIFELHERPATGGQVYQATARKGDLNRLLQRGAGIKDLGLGCCTCVEQVNGQSHSFYRLVMSDEVPTVPGKRNRDGSLRTNWYSVKPDSGKKPPNKGGWRSQRGGGMAFGAKANPVQMSDISVENQPGIEHYRAKYSNPKPVEKRAALPLKPQIDLFEGFEPSQQSFLDYESGKAS